MAYPAEWPKKGAHAITHRLYADSGDSSNTDSEKDNGSPGPEPAPVKPSKVMLPVTAVRRPWLPCTPAA